MDKDKAAAMWVAKNKAKVNAWLEVSRAAWRGRHRPAARSIAPA